MVGDGKPASKTRARQAIAREPPSRENRKAFILSPSMGIWPETGTASTTDFDPGAVYIRRGNLTESPSESARQLIRGA
jgi:hypothetical protein